MCNPKDSMDVCINPYAAPLVNQSGKLPEAKTTTTPKFTFKQAVADHKQAAAAASIPCASKTG